MREFVTFYTNNTNPGWAGCHLWWLMLGFSKSSPKYSWIFMVWVEFHKNFSTQHFNREFHPTQHNMLLPSTQKSIETPLVIVDNKVYYYYCCLYIRVRDIDNTLIWHDCEIKLLLFIWIWLSLLFSTKYWKRQGKTKQNQVIITLIDDTSLYVGI